MSATPLLCILLPRKRKAITSTLHIKQTWELFNPKVADLTLCSTAQRYLEKRWDGSNCHAATRKFGACQKGLWDKMALPRAKSHRKCDGGFLGMQHRETQAAGGVLSSPREKKLNYAFILLKSCFETYFCSFIFSANIHTPVNAIVRVFMLTWVSTAGTEVPLRVLGRAAFNNVGLLGLLVSTPTLIPLSSKRRYCV